MFKVSHLTVVTDGGMTLNYAGSTFPNTTANSGSAYRQSISYTLN